MKKKTPLFERFHSFLQKTLPEMTVADICSSISTLIMIILCIYLLLTGP